MKTLVIMNEPFEKMVLGRNTTLAYILAAFELGHEVYIYNIPNGPEPFLREANSSILAFKLEKRQAGKLAKQYKLINQRIVFHVQHKDYAQLSAMPLIEVQNFVKKVETSLLLLKDIDVVLQRTEPMKAPFPPHGSQDVDKILKKIRKAFPSHILFNCPMGLKDKDIPQEMNAILARRKERLISTPTAEFKLKDKSFMDAFEAMKKEYCHLYGKKNPKLVVKPKNSAQTLGVFALEFGPEGFDLASLQAQTVSQLSEHQLYHIKDDISEKDLKPVIEILCFIQRAKDNKIIFDIFEKKHLSDIKRGDITRNAKELYNEEVLVQPFLEGVKSGDVRMNYLKNKEGDFYLAGSVFRSSLRKEKSNEFTTAYITGGATSKPLSALFAAEEDDIAKKSDIILDILNNDLRKKYRNATELGADFILVGDNKTALLGEINHHCQGLIPVGEAMEKSADLHTEYDGGLALVKRAIKDNIELQKKGGSGEGT